MGIEKDINRADTCSKADSRSSGYAFSVVDDDGTPMRCANASSSSKRERMPSIVFLNSVAKKSRSQEGVFKSVLNCKVQVQSFRLDASPDIKI